MYKQTYDQGAYPQAELHTYDQGAGCLAGFGWLAEAQKGPERPRDAQRGTEGAWIEQACRELGWGLPTSRFTTREAPHKQIYDQGGSPRRTWFDPQSKVVLQRGQKQEAPHKQICSAGAPLVLPRCSPQQEFR